MILAALLMAASTPVSAASDPARFDLRCLILTAQLRQSEEPAIRRFGETGSYFFFGRVDARVPEADLEDRMWQEAQAMALEDRRAILQACAELMEARGQLLIDIGGRIAERERAAAQQRRSDHD